MQNNETLLISQLIDTQTQTFNLKRENFQKIECQAYLVCDRFFTIVDPKFSWMASNSIYFAMNALFFQTLPT
jgi:hypothetical protein